MRCSKWPVLQKPLISTEDNLAGKCAGSDGVESQAFAAPMEWTARLSQAGARPDGRKKKKKAAAAIDNNQWAVPCAPGGGRSHTAPPVGDWSAVPGSQFRRFAWRIGNQKSCLLVTDEQARGA